MQSHGVFSYVYLIGKDNDMSKPIYMVRYAMNEPSEARDDDLYAHYRSFDRALQGVKFVIGDVYATPVTEGLSWRLCGDQGIATIIKTYIVDE